MSEPQERGGSPHFDGDSAARWKRESPVSLHGEGHLTLSERGLRKGERNIQRVSRFIIDSGRFPGKEGDRAVSFSLSSKGRARETYRGREVNG